MASPSRSQMGYLASAWFNLREKYAIGFSSQSWIYERTAPIPVLEASIVIMNGKLVFGYAKTGGEVNKWISLLYAF